MEEVREEKGNLRGSELGGMGGRVRVAEMEAARGREREGWECEVVLQRKWRPKAKVEGLNDNTLITEFR